MEVSDIPALGGGGEIKMITEIGALVGIIKTLLDATKTGFDLLGKKPAAIESVKKTQERLAGIADQLFQSVALLKM